MKKAIWTLNVNGYSSTIVGLSCPLLKHYADKIGAEFRTIVEKKWPSLPPAYEKLQIFELGRGYDWNVYIDSDALVHPDMFDVTEHLSRDTVCHNGCDMAGNRWRYDDYFRRDGRHIGSCNWFTVASDWCLDLWKPLDDMTYEEALESIFPIQNELKSGVIDRAHLLDDYVLSRNIARFGLKFTTVFDIMKRMGHEGSYLWHQYTLPADKKIEGMKETLKAWGL